MSESKHTPGPWRKSSESTPQKDLEQAETDLRDILRQAVGHCRATRGDITTYGRRITAIYRAVPGARDAARGVEKRIIEVHGEWARIALAE